MLTAGQLVANDYNETGLKREQTGLNRQKTGFRPKKIRPGRSFDGTDPGWKPI